MKAKEYLEDNQKVVTQQGEWMEEFLR